MKILHVLPSIRSGGVANFVYNLATYQRKQNGKVDLYASCPQMQVETVEPTVLFL